MFYCFDVVVVFVVFEMVVVLGGDDFEDVVFDGEFWSEIGCEKFF